MSLLSLPLLLPPLPAASPRQDTAAAAAEKMGMGSKTTTTHEKPTGISGTSDIGGKVREEREGRERAEQGDGSCRRPIAHLAGRPLFS